MSLILTLSPELKRRLVYANLAIFIMLAFGTLGIHYIEGFTWLESIYFTAATVTTVGYGDYVPVTRNGRIFTMFFILLGVGTFLYALSILAQALIHAEIISALGIRRKTREMEKLKNHYIVCGAGRVGKRIINELQKKNIPFVVIEQNPEKTDGLEFFTNEFFLTADATLEENLKTAGVEKAKGLAACLANDASNVYVVLTSRSLNKNLHIVSRAVEEQAEPILIQAGANRVVSPTIIGSLSMSRALLKPAIADFMETIVAESLDLVFEEILIGRKSPYANVKLKDTNISSELKLLVVAIRKSSGEMVFNPSSKTTILEGDLLVVIGNAESMKQLVELN